MILRRNNKLFVTALLLSFTTFFSCGKNKMDSANLSVTIEPQRYFLEQIVGDKYTVNSLVPQGANPESFDPAPSQMMLLSSSNAYFKIGFLGIENTLIEKIKHENNLNIVDCSAGISVVDHVCNDEHNHNHDGEHDHSHSHAGGDPHYWSSITSAKIMLGNMLSAMISLDPNNKEFYTSNYQVEIAKISDTDSIIRNILSTSESKSFVIYHPSLSYFAQEFDLEQLSIEREGKNPAPAQLKSLIDEARDRGVKAVFIQQEFDAKNAEIIAKEIGAQIYSINLLAYNWHDEMIKIAKAIAQK